MIINVIDVQQKKYWIQFSNKIYFKIKIKLDIKIL